MSFMLLWRRPTGTIVPMPSDQHVLAVRRAFSLACGAADNGNYAEALDQVATIEAADGRLPPAWAAQRDLWDAAYEHAQRIARGHASPHDPADN